MPPEEMSTLICTEMLTDQPLTIVTRAGEGEKASALIPIEGSGALVASDNGIDDLLRSARKAFQTIEPWCQVTVT